jgi:hypothetical protein
LLAEMIDHLLLRQDQSTDTGWSRQLVRC